MDTETMFVDHVKANFDLDAMLTAKLGYDAMYGARRRVLPGIIPDTRLVHCEYNPSFMGQAPEPAIHRNLQEFSTLIRRRASSAALATDGDADRIRLYNGRGEFIDSHRIILLLIRGEVQAIHRQGGEWPSAPRPR
ncbi:MAG: hypothetical protein R2810_04045 [Flavobacteriales bacterium]